jgi:hypothetical protein
MVIYLGFEKRATLFKKVELENKNVSKKITVRRSWKMLSSGIQTLRVLSISSFLFFRLLTPWIFYNS